ncbi:MAG: hypothetical protein IKH36_01840 [Bacilli bacterium]|nr:hypothetical protein [Bacilli bacterium]
MNNLDKNIFILQSFNYCRCELYNNYIILWITHNKDFTLGTYYKIMKDSNTVYYVIDKSTEYTEIQLNNL